MPTAEQKHTPPLKIPAIGQWVAGDHKSPYSPTDRINIYVRRACDWEVVGSVDGTGEEAQAKANKIANAVNSHEQLVAALKDIEKFLDVAKERLDCLVKYDMIQKCDALHTLQENLSIALGLAQTATVEAK